MLPTKAAYLTNDAPPISVAKYCKQQSHTDRHQRIADIHGVPCNAVNPASYQAAGVNLPIFTASMNIFETDRRDPNSLAEQG
jgi:hypothetical protein